MKSRTPPLILIVDDNEATRYSMGWALKEGGFAVREAASGREAIRYILDMPDLIILDVKLPDISGFDVCSAVKNDPATALIPILHVSACYTTPQHRIQGLDKGADAYLIHPIEPPELVAIVNALLRAKDKAAEARIAAQALQTTFDAIPDGVCLVDQQGVILQANKAMSMILHGTSTTLIGKRLDKELANTLGTNAELTSIFGGTTVKSTFNQEISGGGKTFNVSASSIDAQQAKASRVFCFTDVTYQKNSAIELQRAKQNAEDANHAKSAFLANMSHEIRTPLGAILGFSELLKEPEIRHAEQMNYVEAINRNGRELGLLIDDILDLSKVESGRLEIERMEISLASLLDDVLSSLAIKADEKGIDLSIRHHGAIPLVISSDPTRLRQILFNVIGNAIKFTPKGKVTIDVTYGGAKGAGEGLLTFTVTDTGQGVSASDFERLFKPFSQADASTTRKFGGTGLGLVLSRKLAQALGGDVVLAESFVGHGSTFVVTIKSGIHADERFEKPELDIPTTASAVPLSSGRALQGVRVLVADDTPDNQALIRTVLNRNGAVVEIVSNGAEAVEKALGNSFDVILMDIQMPVLDGYNAAEALRSKDYKGPIIALTAHAMQGEKERCLKAGCNDHLAKPFTGKSLVYLVAQYKSQFARPAESAAIPIS